MQRTVLPGVKYTGELVVEVAARSFLLDDLCVAVVAQAGGLVLIVHHPNSLRARQAVETGWGIGWHEGE